MSKKVAVIIGSSRPSRIGANISNWVLTKLPKSENVIYEIVDLAEWKLPLLNEPLQAKLHKYEFEYTKEWGAKIEEFDGFVFVTPEYNAGYSAVLKNAIDYLYDEWKDKPATIVSYGWSGGASANNQLREVLIRIGLKITDTLPKLNFSGDIFDEQAQVKDVEQAFGSHANEIQKAGEELTVLIEDVA